MFDVLIRNATVVREGRPVLVDVGINHNEVNDKTASTFFYKSIIEDIGDLSTFYGLEEIDATGLTLSPAQVYADTLDSVAELAKLDLPALRREGIVAFNVRKNLNKKYSDQAGASSEERQSCRRKPLQLEQIPTFLLMKGKQIQYRFVNGFWEGSQLIKQNGVID